MPTLSKTDIQQFLMLLKSIRVSTEEFDEFLFNSPHIYRSIRGHAFEVWFDRELAERGYKTEKVGGDNVVDRVLNGKTLQLKTSYINGTKTNVVVSYKMHKTHGAETMPLCFYKKEEFADFFVGQHPTLGVIICPKDKLKTRAEVNPKLPYGEYISDPLPFEWNTEWLNRYELIGLEIDDYPKVKEHSQEEVQLFPKLISKIGFTDYDILKALLDPLNFRLWNQSIIGTIREFHFEREAKKRNIELFPPQDLGGRENQKVDYVTKKGLLLQVKGLTKGLCRNGLLGVETQASHSRIPTRLYKPSDFHMLVVVIDPLMIPPEIAAMKKVNNEEYNYLVIPMSKLPIHPKSKEWGQERIRPYITFNPIEKNLNNFDLLLGNPNS